MKHLTTLGLLVFVTSLPADSALGSSPAVLQQAEQPLDAALKDDTAWEWVEGLSSGLAGNHDAAPVPDALRASIAQVHHGRPSAAVSWPLAVSLRRSPTEA